MDLLRGISNWKSHPICVTTQSKCHSIRAALAALCGGLTLTASPISADNVKPQEPPTVVDRRVGSTAEESLKVEGCYAYKKQLPSLYHTVGIVDRETQVHYIEETNPVYAPAAETIILGMIEASHKTPTPIGAFMGLDPTKWTQVAVNTADALHLFGKTEGCGAYVATFITAIPRPHEKEQMDYVGKLFDADAVTGNPRVVEKNINGRLKENNITLEIEDVRAEAFGFVTGVKLKTEWETKFNPEDVIYQPFDGSTEDVKYLVQSFKGVQDPIFAFGTFTQEGKTYEVVKKRGTNGIDVVLMKTEDPIAFDLTKVEWEEPQAAITYRLQVPEFKATFKDKSFEELVRRFGVSTILGYPLVESSLQAEFEFTAEGAEGQAVVMVQGTKSLAPKRERDFVFDTSFRWWACSPNGVPMLAGAVNNASCMKSAE